MDSTSTTTQMVQLDDQRQEAIQQKKMQGLVNNSSVLATQRKTLDRVMGIVQKVSTEEEAAQMKTDGVHQLNSGLEEELPIQKKDDNRTGMPDNLKAGVESLSGMAMDHVKVHYNSDKPAQLSALAYAQGSDIHIGAGQEQHLPHEAWHVVQQMQGRVQPTLQMQGVDINDDNALETEADVMGAKALQG